MKKNLLFIFLLCFCDMTAHAQMELLKNPSFEEEAKPIRNRRFGPNGEGELFGARLPKGIILGWITADNQQENSKIEVTTENLLDDMQHKALRWEITAVPASIANVGNQGTWAIKDNKYRLTFWARSDKRYKGTLRVGLQSKSDDVWYAQARVKGRIKKRWKKYSVTFTTKGNDPNMRFVMTADKPGMLYIDCVSLTAI